jgi:hypothetical protein
MALFDTLISDAAGRFGLGAKAGPLVREVLNLAAGSPGSLAGFFGQIQIGRSRLGSRFLARPHQRRGLAGETTRTRARLQRARRHRQQTRPWRTVRIEGGRIHIAEIIGALTPGGSVPASLPSEVTKFLSPAAGQRAAEQFVPRSIEVVRDKPNVARWLLPAALPPPLSWRSPPTSLRAGRRPDATASGASACTAARSARESACLNKIRAGNI